MIKNKESIIAIRLTEEMKKKLTAKAYKEGKRMSEYIRQMIEEAIKK